MTGIAARLTFFMRDERGAAAAEYGLLLAVVVVLTAVGVAALGDSLTAELQNAAGCVETGCG